MASKQVQDLLVRLKIDGLEGLDSLKGAFRELAKTIGPTEQTIEKARQSIIEFGEAGTKSEQLIKGQIAALRGLQNQATQNGEVYNKLTGNIKELENAAYGASAAVEEQRKRLTAFGASADATALQVQQAINALIRLRGETRIDSDAFNKFGESIATLANRFKAVSQEAQNFADAQRRIVRPIGASSAAARQQIRDLELVTESLRNQRDELGALEGEARIRVGAAGLAERGAPAAGRRTFEEAVSESLFGGDIKKLLPAKDIKAALDEVARQINEFQREIETNLSRGIQRSFQETARAGRESARAMAAAFSDSELLNVFNRFDQRLGELPETATGFSQRLRELQQVFANTAVSAENYISVALEIARVQRQASATAQGLGAALVRDLDTGVAVRNKKNLQEAIGQLRAEMNELDTQTTEGARAYAENANQARALESQLRQLGNSYRHVADMATQAATAQASEATARVTANYLTRGIVRQQEQAMEELGQRVRAGVAGTPLALPAAGGTTAPGTGQAISGGARRFTGPIETTFDVSGRRMARTIGERSGYYNPPTAATGAAAAVGQSAEVINRANKSYSNLIVNLREVLLASNGSISSLDRQRSAWSALREAVDPASKQFANSTKQIEALDARLAKLQQTQRRRMSGMQMAQAAGAAISGGIFGGPEGFLGGAIGGITAGVGGAFVGAAAGAQVGMLRQQLGGFADYAAQIQKMKIALEGAAGGQEQFNQALSAANSVVRNLNVPQDVAIKGMTQLTAAVKGAGGEVSDAELVFKNITSAIKATGGSAQDVDGAITAMVQVFSKGKVSAEEISGQLGERLPGAVTKFAKANNMSLPEFQKQLEQGRVGLREMMNFIIYLGNENAEVADKMAKSSQDAGARLTVAYNDMRISIGAALQPVGAQLQETFARFVTDIAPAVAASAKGIADAFSFFLNNEILSGIAAFALKLGLVTAATIALRAAITSLAQINILSWFTGVTSAARITGDVMATSAVKVTGFATAMRGLLGILRGIAALGAITVAIDVVVRGFAQLMAARQALRELNAKRDPVGATGPQPAMTAERRYTGAAREKVAEDINKQREYAARLRKEIQDIESQLLVAESVGAGRASLFTAGLKAQADLKKAQLRDAEEVVKLDLKTFKTREQIQSEYMRGMNERFKSPAGDSEDKKAKSEAEKAAREAQRRFDEEMQRLVEAENYTLNKFSLEEKIRLEREKQSAVQSGALESEMRLKEIANQRLDLDIRQTALSDEQKKLGELRNRGLAEGLDLEKIDKKMRDNALEDLKIKYENEKINTQEMQEQNNLLKERQKLDRSLNQELEDRRYELGLITKEEYNRLRVERERRRLQDQYGVAPGSQGRINEAADLFRREIDPTFAEGLQTQLAIVRRELDDLTKPINQVVGAANAIGDAFSQSFASVINGSATTQEALASFFQNLANYFLDMAAQIIQKMIVMAILNQIVGLLPGAGGIGQKTAPASPLQSGGDFNIPGTISTGIFAAANGAAFGKNGIQPFAMGGIVNKPTLFKYADGGTGRFGLMGEAGPEAIIPLKRGRDGRLGVSGGGSTNVTVNVDAQGTQVQGNDNRGQQLGRVVAAAVQAELIKQKRPGGLLA